MPLYTLLCGSCRMSSEHLLGMNDNRGLVKCPGCGARGMKRDWATDGPTVGFTGDLPTLGPGYDYMDHALGYVKNRRDREDKMRAKGLTEWDPVPEVQRARDEGRYAVESAGPDEKRTARMAAHAAIKKAAKEHQSRVRRERFGREIKRVLDDV